MSMPVCSSRIMMIEPLDDGGIAHYAFNLVTALASHADITLITSANFEFRGKQSLFVIYPIMFRWAGSLINRFPGLSRETSLPSFLRRLLKLLEYPVNTVESLIIVLKKNIKIAHIQTVNLTELLMIMALKAAGVRIVFTIHNVMPRHRKLHFYHRILYRLMYGLCDRLIIHSNAGKDDVVSLFSIEPDKITVIPHGNYKFFLPDEKVTAGQAKAALAIQPSARTILFFGAVRPNKGLEVLLRAFPLIKQKIPGTMLLVVGEPCEDYSRYRKMIEQGGFAESVLEVLEYVPNKDVAKYFFASDVVVLPYHEITQSGVLQIAYAFGKPVVATAIGGFTEAVEEGANGYLVSPGDSNALARGIAAILDDPVAMERMGRRSRYLADTEYSWSSIGEQTFKIYEGLMPGCRQ